jgi:prevent-host-death family protein
MKKAVNARGEKTQFSTLLGRVAAGEQITIANRGVPVARLVPVRTHRSNGNLRREEFRSCWGGRRGSNPRHSVPQTDALPAELLPPLRVSLA